MRNFYGDGHGNDESFINFTGGFLGSPQRYRFAFLDGCNSYSYACFSCFGAAFQEIPAQQRVDNGNPGFTDTSWYQTNGLRPAAFVGNIVAEPWIYVHAPPDFSLAGRVLYRTIEARANWHVQLLSQWAIFGEQLYNAKIYADAQAWVNATGTTSTSFAPAPPPLSWLNMGSDAYGTIYWSPVTCLKIAGYINLKFNEFNHAGDTW